MQEHFLLDSLDKRNSNTGKIKKLFGDTCDMFIVPDQKDNNSVTYGRGSGGLVIMWKKYLTKYVTKVSSSTYRVQAMKFDIPGNEFLLINSYFPCDPRNDNDHNTELLEVLGDIRSIILTTQYNRVLMVGDLNCHFARQNRFTNTIYDCLDSLSLIPIWENIDNDPDHLIHSVDYTYLNLANGVISTSILDHFCVSQSIFNAIKEAGVTHSSENLSNHSAVFMKIGLCNIDNQVETVLNEKRVSWAKASDDAKEIFKELLTNKLDSISLPDSALCRSLQCRDHENEIEEYTLDILHAIESAGQESLPSNSQIRKIKSKSNKVPGWTDFVKPYADENKFWSSTWRSLGRPNYGPYFEAMKLARKQYSYAVRRLKRCNEIIQNNKFLDGLVNRNNNCDIFKEIRKFRGSQKTSSSRIDDQTGSSNIANHFAGIYSALYNRVENGENLTQISDLIQSKLSETSYIKLDQVNEPLVKRALGTMKSCKKDSLFDTVSDCYLNGPPQLVQHLTRLIKMYLVHGYVPSAILICTLTPLIKDNFGDITSSC